MRLGAAARETIAGCLVAARTAAQAPEPPAPPSPAELREIPRPDLAGLEPIVREALERAAAALAAAPDEAAVQGELGLVLHAHGFAAAAEVGYDNAARLAPDDYRWPHLRGLALLDEQRLDEAAAAFAESFARRPYYPALLRQARTEQQLGRLERAADLLEIAAAHSPDDPALLALLGEQTALVGDDRAAVELLSRALAAAPGATRLHYPLALSYRALGDAEAAARHLALAGRVGIVPLDPLEGEMRARRVGATVWDLEGQRALQAGDAGAAAHAFRKAHEARPDDPALLSRLRAAEAAASATPR
jgi:tetratricopeptide (TPR) repeat protein